MDDLKDIWQKGEIEIKTPDLPKKWKYNRIDLAHRILKSLKFEYYANILLGLIYIPAFFYLELYLFLAGSLVLIVPVLFYYKSFMKKMEALHYENDVHAYLKELYRLTRRFMRHYIGYILFSLILAPPLVIFYLWLEGQDTYNSKFITIMVAFIIGTGMGMCVGFHFKYGRHFKKIKEMVKMLEE